MSYSDLRFNKKVIDVKMAEEYLNKNTEFHSMGCADNGNIDYDDYNNKIYMSSYDTFKFKLSNESLSDKSMKFMNLAEKIIENIDLFCQLEYLIRKIPVEVTKNIDIKLLTQHFIYQSSSEEENKPCISEIYMTNETPLATLGCVALQSKSQKVAIISTKETAVICSLFVNLCHDAGLQDVVFLVLLSRLPMASSETVLLPFIEEFRTGCVGVVTETADIDSAVDTFLYATSRSPWHIKKIFVQECALSHFKRCIEWKTKKPSSDVDENLLKSCTSVHVYEDKLYLFEFAGNIKNISENSIIIEAYRTSKELISLMSAIKTLGVSLWSSNIAGSNEIAYNINSNIVWINDFGCFEGPPVTSQTFYSPINKYHEIPYETSLWKKIEKDELLKKRSTWLNLDIPARHLKIWKATKNIIEHKNLKTEIITKCANNSIINIGNKVCMVIRNPLNILFVSVKTYQDILKYIKFIISGSALVFIVEKSSEQDVILKYCQELAKTEAPIAFITDESGEGEFQLQFSTKVVWSSIGTIFAN